MVYTELFIKGNNYNIKYDMEEMETHFQIPLRIIEDKRKEVTKLEPIPFKLTKEQKVSIYRKTEHIIENLKAIF